MSKKKKIIRTLFVIAAFGAVVLFSYLTLIWTGVWEDINSVEKIKKFILKMGFWGRFAFVMIQFLQVTFLPLPSAVTTLAGSLIFGPLQASLLSLSGILFGSAFAFLLGRIFGKKLIVFMAGEESYKKWTKVMTDAKYSYFVMMIMPIFPDDILCLIAGTTDMSWAFFTVTNLIARPLGIFMTCYFGSGEIIPYSGWGLAVWAVFLVFVGVVVYLSFKYSKQIEGFLRTKFKRKHS